MPLSPPADAIARMLDAAPCPVSETLILHHLRLDGEGDRPLSLQVVQAALSELREAKRAIHVDHRRLVDRWPPEAFAAVKAGEHDDAVQLAIGAWASTKRVKQFDQTVRRAHLQKDKEPKLRPYLDIGWWGHIEPSADFVAQAEQSMKTYARFYGY